MRRFAAIGLLLTGLAACGGQDSGETAQTSADTAAAPGMGPDSLTPVGPTNAQDSAMARDLADAPSAGIGTGRATARMRDASGRDLGEIVLAETAQGIQVTGQLRGVPPGQHAFHIHTTGRCEPPFQSAGGHWNPTNTQHGTQAPGGPHLGDMLNVTAGADSTAALQGTTPGGTLRGATNAVLDRDGAAVLIHAKADDYRSQPAGDAGDRIACGVVEMGT